MSFFSFFFWRVDQSFCVKPLQVWKFLLFLICLDHPIVRGGRGLAGTVLFELPSCNPQNLGIFWVVWLFQKKIFDKQETLPRSNHILKIKWEIHFFKCHIFRINASHFFRIEFMKGLIKKTCTFTFMRFQFGALSKI